MDEKKQRERIGADVRGWILLAWEEAAWYARVVTAVDVFPGDGTARDLARLGDAALRLRGLARVATRRWEEAERLLAEARRIPRERQG